MSEQTYKIAAAVLLCTTIIAGVLAVQYNAKLQTAETEYSILLEELEGTTATVNILIDNGEESTWYNDTRVPLGSNLLNATAYVAELDLQSSEWGVFVVSIGEVGGDANHYWLWDYLDEGWQMGPVGADQWTVHDGDVLRWTYTSFE
jgi:hypothetical protein